MTEEGTSKTLEDPSVWEDSVSSVFFKLILLIVYTNRYITYKCLLFNQL